MKVETYDMLGNGDGETVATLTGDHAGRPTDYTPVVCASGKLPDSRYLCAECGTYHAYGESCDEFWDGMAKHPFAKSKPDVVAFAQNTRDEVRMCNGDGSITGALAAEPGMKQQTYIAIQDVRGMDKKQNGRGYNEDGTAYTVDAMATQGVCAFAQNQLGEVRAGDIANTLNTNANASKRNTAMVAIGIDEEQNAHVEMMGCLKARELGGGFEGSVMTPSSSVRRLTPVECERLQGLPDGHTLIPWRGKPANECPDGPRYKGVGNGQTVDVMEWLARRIKRGIERDSPIPT